MMTEEWRPVVGWEGLYEVSSHGRVRSLDRIVIEKGGKTRRKAGRVMKTPPNRKGYFSLNLSAGPETKQRQVHVLVAAAFIGPRPEGMVIRHLDGHQANNRADNLAYGTPLENTWDIPRHNPNSRIGATVCPYGHPIEGENRRIMVTGRPTCKACERAHSWASHQVHMGRGRPPKSARIRRSHEIFERLTGAAS